MWSWWMERNKANVGDRAPSVLKIERAYVLAAEFLRARKEQPSISGESIRKGNTWNPPSLDVLKINSDGSFHEKEKTGAWSFVVRDSDGHGVLAGSGKTGHCP